jgi:DNA-binding response OmpR family regulator
VRLLILDGSRILSSLVERLVPECIEIVQVSTFDEAVKSLHSNPPDAVIANVGPTALPWREFKEYCVNHRPRIPILFESCVYRNSVDAGIGGLDYSTAFLTKPYALSDLRRQLERLVRYSSVDEDLETSVARGDRPPAFHTG